MNIWSKIKNLDKNFSWSFMGFLVGIIGIGFAVYTIYFYQEKPNIEYYQLTNTSVLDLKENVTKLDVIYDSTSIKKNRQSLRVVTIKILNSGNEDLGPQHYDKTVPLGLKIKGGVIVETPQIIETSNEYISERLKINWLSENEISFSQFIINQNESFTLKLLLLTQENIIPELSATGYITGLGKPTLRTDFNKPEEKSFLARVFEGNFLIHIVRSILYFVIFVISLIAIFISVITISESRNKRKRKSIVNKFRKHTKLNKEEISEIVLDYYLKFQEGYLFRIENFISKDEMIIDYKRYLDLEEKISDFNSDFYDEPMRAGVFYEDKDQKERFIAKRNSNILNRLIEDKVLKIEEDKVEVEKSFESTLKELIYFIKIQ
ncbi:hypothetical protein N9W32_04265 [Flavobacteriaceae bacterium]|nr:hypothetical protein [Flavobacteriaceae bacterium]